MATNANCGYECEFRLQTSSNRCDLCFIYVSIMLLDEGMCKRVIAEHKLDQQ